MKGESDPTSSAYLDLRRVGQLKKLANRFHIGKLKFPMAIYNLEQTSYVSAADSAV
jgi:hypothetical protein